MGTEGTRGQRRGSAGRHLQQAEVVRLIEGVDHPDVALLQVGEQLKQRAQSRLGNVALRVLEGPLDRLDDQRKIGLLLQQCREAVLVHRAQQVEEQRAVVGVVLEILGDHVERALEDGLEHARHLRRHLPLQLVDQPSEEREHLTGAGVDRGRGQEIAAQ